ncbi:DUF4145 domain-containing protein [Agromyces cerinus]|uniref:DUF4145 domain-containing protein n=1 Tax=Agromyces cerinus subsp. cerinus TaxID=232089 RepID=A0A1N6F7K4_9MICO|nr:DUF4145 domain-containing protein [Agromyces cerinus]SIN91255.1 protein of unknown function [Agromyces cerinus subsp. cerinus]
MAKPLGALSGWLNEDTWPRVLCPECLEGTLALKSTTQYPDARSRAHIELVRRHLDGPDELGGSFTGVLECDNHGCKREAAIAGDWAYLWSFDDVQERERLTDFFALRHISPAPQLLLTPQRTPTKVVEAIAMASSVLWTSPDLAATQLRLAVEELLTARGVKRTFITAKRKRKRLSAQERLDIFASTHPEVVHALEAVKWIGNTGTHESGLSIDDVVTGAKFLELALRRLYDTNEADLLATAKDINRRRGLPRVR